MVILAVESTAHTLSIALLDETGRVLVEERDQLTTSEGGLIPIKIQEHHLSVLPHLLKRVREKAGRAWHDISRIALSTAPGIGHALRVGLITTVHLANRLHIPLIPVHHGLAHLTSGLLLTESRNAVLVYTSGANTQLYTYYDDWLSLVGETLDMSLGNMLDSIARLLGLGFPGGPQLERLAREGKTLLELPYTVKGMDIAYGGFYTAVKRLIEAGRPAADIALSVQEYAFAMLLEAAERAMALYDADTLILIGGVALNERFARMAGMLTASRNARLLIPPRHVLGDNAIMIGLEALRRETCEGFTPLPPARIPAEVQPYARIPTRMHYARCLTLNREHLTPGKV